MRSPTSSTCRRRRRRRQTARAATRTAAAAAAAAARGRWAWRLTRVRSGCSSWARWAVGCCMATPTLSSPST
eukprot:5428993-Prymnesium_polylepis.2